MIFIKTGFGATKTFRQHDIVMCTCTADSVLRWKGTAITHQCPADVITFHITNLTYQYTYESQCGDFNVSTTKKWIESCIPNETQNFSVIESTLN